MCRDIYSIPYPYVSHIQWLWTPGQEKGRWPNSHVLTKYHPSLPVLEAGCGVGNWLHSLGCLSQSCRIWNFSSIHTFCLFLLKTLVSYALSIIFLWSGSTRQRLYFSIFTEQSKFLCLYMVLKDPVGIYWGIFIPHAPPHRNSTEFQSLSRPDL